MGRWVCRTGDTLRLGANGDRVTTVLVQGVVNTFVVFLSRVTGHFVDKVVLRNPNGGSGRGSSH